MTNYAWGSAASGNWSLGTNWSPTGGPPQSSDNAAFAATGSNYTVTVSSSDVADALTLSSANATLSVDGTNALLTLSGLFIMGAGTLNVATTATASGQLVANDGIKLSGGTLNVNRGGTLNLTGTLAQSGGKFILNGGTVSGGTIDSTGGTVTINSGTLSGVLFDRPLNLTAGDASLHIANGTEVVGSSGTGAGVINVTGYGATLDFDNTQTVADDTINLGNASYWAFIVANDAGNVENQVLTLAKSIVVNVSDDAYFGGDGIVNDGLIQQTGSASGEFGFKIACDDFTNAGTLSNADALACINIDATNFTNSGTLSVSNGAEILIEPTTFITTATSVITIGANSTLDVDVGGSVAWSNLGSISLASGATLDAYGETFAASLGTVTNSDGTVYIYGAYTNSGQTLNQGDRISKQGQ